MPILRIMTAGAALIMAVNAAAAQSTATPGKPVSLIQAAKQDPATPHAKAVAKRTARKTRWAKKSHDDADSTAAEPEQSAQPQQAAGDEATPNTATPTAAASTTIWSAGAPSLPGIPSDAAAQVAPDSVDQAVREFVVDGQTVQVATADKVNAIDLAADDSEASAPDPIDKVRSTSAAVSAFAQDDDAKRDTWFEEILATLGGALAAGTVAWFFMVSSARRIYEQI